MISSGRDGSWAEWSNRADAMTLAIVFAGIVVVEVVHCVLDVQTSQFGSLFAEVLIVLFTGFSAVFYACGLSIRSGPTGVHMRTGVFTRDLAWDEIAGFGVRSMVRAECFAVTTTDGKVRRGPFYFNGGRRDVGEFLELLKEQLAYVRKYGGTSATPER